MTSAGPTCARVRVFIPFGCDYVTTGPFSPLLLCSCSSPFAQMFALRRSVARAVRSPALARGYAEAAAPSEGLRLSLVLPHEVPLPATPNPRARAQPLSLSCRSSSRARRSSRSTSPPKVETWECQFFPPGRQKPSHEASSEEASSVGREADMVCACSAASPTTFPRSSRSSRE